MIDYTYIGYATERTKMYKKATGHIPGVMADVYAGQEAEAYRRALQNDHVALARKAGRTPDLTDVAKNSFEQKTYNNTGVSRRNVRSARGEVALSGEAPMTQRQYTKQLYNEASKKTSPSITTFSNKPNQELAIIPPRNVTKVHQGVTPGSSGTGSGGVFNAPARVGSNGFNPPVKQGPEVLGTPRKKTYESRMGQKIVDADFEVVPDVSKASKAKAWNAHKTVSPKVPKAVPPVNANSFRNTVVNASKKGLNRVSTFAKNSPFKALGMALGAGALAGGIGHEIIDND